MKRHILLDGISLTNKPKGAQIYILNLLREFAKLDNGYVFTVLINKNEALTGLPISRVLIYEPISARYPYLWKLLNLSSYIRHGNFDLVHFPTETVMPRNIVIPYILTVNESLQKYYLAERKHSPVWIWRYRKPYLHNRSWRHNHL